MFTFCKRCCCTCACSNLFTKISFRLRNDADSKICRSTSNNSGAFIEDFWSFGGGSIDDESLSISLTSFNVGQSSSWLIGCSSSLLFGFC
ncbi:hypothetical protein DERP_007968 [Dermatophagoides pteronyssinus]|uniref:Uncharacterized protein n=1 Tax=Dermatophagoides pteronyssinus TaxID=6956 RepID=A0ABQ8ITU2_DERPT|nr:hypothetical protein DERP_007968 [Dermatophagoides pteronyssinus]